MQVTSRPLILAAVVVIVAVVALGGWLVLRPGASAAVGEVAIECTAATGASSEECATWGRAILADDPAPRTFEREDVRQLRIDRSALGFGDECRVAYYLSRYRDSPVWQGEVPCR
jgi:hypothetical protein